MCMLVSCHRLACLSKYDLHIVTSLLPGQLKVLTNQLELYLQDLLQFLSSAHSRKYKNLCVQCALCHYAQKYKADLHIR